MINNIMILVSFFSFIDISASKVKQIWKYSFSTVFSTVFSLKILLMSAVSSSRNWEKCWILLFCWRELYNENIPLFWIILVSIVFWNHKLFYWFGNRILYKISSQSNFLFYLYWWQFYEPILFHSKVLKFIWYLVSLPQL